jgi:hypothetical protein
VSTSDFDTVVTVINGHAVDLPRVQYANHIIMNMERIQFLVYPTSCVGVGLKKQQNDVSEIVSIELIEKGFPTEKVEFLCKFRGLGYNFFYKCAKIIFAPNIIEWREKGFPNRKSVKFSPNLRGFGVSTFFENLPPFFRLQAPLSCWEGSDCVNILTY